MTVRSPFSDLSAETSAALEVRLLGLVDFESALLLQERLVYEISGRNDAFGALLLCEHPPLITVGREGSRAHLRAGPEELTARQLEVRWLNRGGGCVVHAPGQLAAYPIVPLDRLGLGLAAYRSRLEESLLDVCRELRLPAHRCPGEPGVWCRTGQVAHLGVTVKSWVTYHGLFLNVSPAPDMLRLVQSNSEGRTTSLSAGRLRPLTMHKVRESVIRNLTSRLGYERHHLYTGHPLLTRTPKKVYVHA